MGLPYRKWVNLNITSEADPGSIIDPTEITGPALRPELTIRAIGSSVPEGSSVIFRVESNINVANDLNVALSITSTGAALTNQPPKSVTIMQGERRVDLILPTTDDGIDAPNIQVIARLQPGAVYDLGVQASATVTVVDDDITAETPILSIEAVNSAVNEGEPALFKVTSDKTITGGALRFNYSLVEFGDVTNHVLESAFIAQGLDNVTIQVQTVDDRVYEPDALLTMLLEDGADYLVNNNKISDSVIVHSDDDPIAGLPNISIFALQPDVDAGQDVRYMLVADTAPAIDTRVNVEIQETGNVLTGQLPTEVLFEAGKITMEITLPTDRTNLNGSRVSAFIKAGGGYNLTPSYLSFVNVSGVVFNPGPIPRLTLVTLSPRVSEGEDLRFVLVSDQETGLVDTEVGITVKETGDMLPTMVPSTVMLFGQTRESVFIIPTVGDDQAEPNSNVTVTLKAGDGYVLGSPNEITVTVLQDDGRVIPVITIATSSGAVTEGSNLTFLVSSDTTAQADISVGIAVTETGNMLAGPLPSSVVIKKGSRAKVLTLATTADSTDEPNSDVTVTLQLGTGYKLGSSQVAGATIIDDDLPVVEDVTIEVQPGEPEYVEGNRLRFRIRSNKRPTSALRINFTISETGGVLGDASPTSALLAAGTNEVDVYVETLADQVEGDDSIVTLILSTGTGYKIGLIGRASISVRDATPGFPQVDIFNLSPTRNEGQSLAYLIFASKNVVVDTTINLSVVETGDMIDGDPPTSVIIPAGTRRVTLNIPTDDDAADETNSRVTVTLKSGVGYSLGQVTQQTSTIVDNDDVVSGTPELTLVVDSAKKSEGSTFNFTVRASVAPQQAITVNLSGTGLGTALVPSANLPATVRIAAGAAGAAFSVATVDDSTDAADAEFTVSIAPGTGYTRGTPHSLTLTVADDDEPAGAPVITIAGVVTSGTEGNTLSFQLRSNKNVSSDLTVNLSNRGTDNSVVKPANIPSTLVISSGTNRSAVTEIPSTDDTVDAADLVFYVGVAVGQGYTVGTAKEVKFTLADNDETASEKPVIQIEAVDSSVGEGDSFRIKIRSDRAIGSAGLTVALNFTSNDDGHFVGGARNVVLRSGNTERTFTYGTGSENTIAGDTTVTITIVARTAYTIGTNKSVSINIEDTTDDLSGPVPEVEISRGTGGTPVEGTAIQFNLSLSEGADDDIDVNVSVSETGNMIDSYPSSVTVAAGDESGEFEVETTDDGLVESNSDITATVDSGTGYTVGSVSSATIRVFDNDSNARERALGRLPLPGLIPEGTLDANPGGLPQSDDSGISVPVRVKHIRSRTRRSQDIIWRGVGTEGTFDVQALQEIDSIVELTIVVILENVEDAPKLELPEADNLGFDYDNQHYLVNQAIRRSDLHWRMTVLAVDPEEAAA